MSLCRFESWGTLGAQGILAQRNRSFGLDSRLKVSGLGVLRSLEISGSELCFLGFGVDVRASCRAWGLPNPKPENLNHKP